jgi:hypothetical protein
LSSLPGTGACTPEPKQPASALPQCDSTVGELHHQPDRGRVRRHSRVGPSRSGDSALMVTAASSPGGSPCPRTPAHSGWLRDPAAGIGKPEPLRHLLAGAWSRRISEEHRLVYLVGGDDIVILQARFHYKQTRETGTRQLRTAAGRPAPGRPLCGGTQPKAGDPLARPAG